MNRHAMDHPSFLPIIARKCLAALALATCLRCRWRPAGRIAHARGAARRGATGRRFHPGEPGRQTVHAADFAGKYTVFYFGYTYCPDVCPLDTANLMQGYHAFAKAHPDKAARLVPIFVSIDPARDTPQVLGQFTGNFGKELVGLTGTPAQIAAVAKEYAVYYQRAAPKGPRPKPI
jgi:protein SCO1/2